jgi:hypothetical protein
MMPAGHNGAAHCVLWSVEDDQRLKEPQRQLLDAIAAGDLDPRLVPSQTQSKRGVSCFAPSPQRGRWRSCASGTTSSSTRRSGTSFETPRRAPSRLRGAALRDTQPVCAVRRAGLTRWRGVGSLAAPCAEC